MGELADLVRRRKNGDVAYYNLNLHINPTNVCIYRCPLCAYSRDEGDPGAYAMSEDEILARGQGGGRGRLHRTAPRRRRPSAQDRSTGTSALIRNLHAAFPRLHLKAWTAVEIDRFAQTTGRPVRGDPRRPDRGRARQSARRRGRDLRPRGPRKSVLARPTPRPGSTSTARPTSWGSAPTPRCSTATSRGVEHRVDHLLRLRDLQDETGGFQAFVPLAFHPQNTALSHLRRVSAAAMTCG